jgi:hypothetical protein
VSVATSYLVPEEPSGRVLPAIESNETRAQQREPFGRLVAALLGHLDRLVVVRDRIIMITTLRGVPDELPHERRGPGFRRMQFTTDIRPQGVGKVVRDSAKFFRGG